MFQHVNNVSQQMYFDLGKADFYRQCFTKIGTVPSNT